MERDDSPDHITFSIASGCFLDHICQLCGNFMAVDVASMLLSAPVVEL